MAEDIILKVALDGAQRELDNLSKLQKGIKELSAEKKRLNQNEKELTKAINESGAATSEQNEQLEKIHAQQLENTNSLKLTKTAYRENEAQVIRNTKAQQGNTGSLVQMRAALAKDQRAYDLLSKAERENEKIGGVLQKRIKAQSDELKNLEKNTGRAQRNVGNYGEAMNDVLPIMGGFGSQIQSVQRSLLAIKTALGKTALAQNGMTKSTKVSTNSLKAFRIALISTGIGAIVVALGALVAAFLSTQRGVDAVTKVLRPLQEIFSSLLGVVQDLATNGLDRLKKAFDNPKQSLIDLGNLIKDNLITRVLAIPKLIKAAAGAILGSFKLIGLGIKNIFKDVPLIGRFIDKEQLKKDLEEAKAETLKSFKDLGKAGIEFQIGVDADTVIDAVKGAAESTGEFFEEAAKRGLEIDRLTKQIEINQVNLNRELKKGERIFQEQRQIAEDINAGTEKQLAAAAAAQAQLKKNVALEQGQLNLQLQLAQLKTEANDTDREAQQEIQDLIAQKEEVEAKALKKGLLLRNKANSIAKKAETDRIKAIQKEEKAKEKLANDEIKSETKIINKKIEGLKLARQLELATIDETNEEKIEKEKALLDEIGALRVQKAKLNGEDVAKVELENQIAKAEKAKEQQATIDEQQLEEETKKEEGKVLVRDAAIQAGEDFAKEIFDNQNRRIDEGLAREVDALNLKREAGEISEEEFAKKRLELDKKAFKDRKRLSLAQNLIDFAVGAGKTVANLGLPAAIPALIALGIQKTAQSAIIASQKFAQGGVIHGASHAQGGVPVSVGGSGMIEAEGGEAIINKRSTSKHLGLLSAINQDGGGVPLAKHGMVTPNFSSLSKFGNGGLATPAAAAQSPSLNIDDLRDAFSSTISNIKVQNVASETTGVANRVQQIEDSASF